LYDNGKWYCLISSHILPVISVSIGHRMNVANVKLWSVLS